MFGQGNGLKQVGVLQSGGPIDQAPSKRVTHFAKAEMYAVRYGDDGGAAHTVMLVKAGSQWYMPPNAEQWSQSLKPLAPWLVEQLEQHLAAQTAPTPKEDTVDVLEAEGKR